MADTLEMFLKESKNAKKIKLEPAIVLERSSKTAQGLAHIKQDGQYGSIARKDQICELEIDNKVFANGKIIKKGDEYYFKITEILS